MYPCARYKLQLKLNTSDSFYASFLKANADIFTSEISQIESWGSLKTNTHLYSHEGTQENRKIALFTILHQN